MTSKSSASVWTVVLWIALILGVAIFVSGYLRSERSPDQPRTVLYSQGNEEAVIRDFFDDRRNGVFLDVGAAHWRDNSTTLYLERHLGWTGIAIDALEEYRAGFEQNRPGTRFFAYLVTDHSGTEEPFFEVDGRESVSSTSKEWIEMIYEGFFPGDRPEIREQRIPTITLTELLDDAGVEKIDFLSMDIEGSEPPALAGFDIDRFAPALVCIEATHSIREAIGDYFDRHGYRRIEAYDALDPYNWYFTRK